MAATCWANSHLKRHPQLLLCKLDINNEGELCFVQMYGIGLFEIGVCIDERCGKWHWLDMPFGRVAWIPV